MNLCTFKTIDNSSIVVISIHDSITFCNIREIRHFILEYVKDESTKNLVLDISEVKTICSDGLGIFVLAFKTCKKLKTGFYLSQPSHYVKEVLKLTSLDKYIPIVTDEDQFLKFIAETDVNNLLKKAM